MKYRTGVALVIIAVAIFLSGCAQDGTPVHPAFDGKVEMGISVSSNSHSLFGLYTFICNPVEGTVEVMPLREAGMHLNALKFLEPPPFLYLTLESPPQFNGNILDVDIGLRNPYAGFVQFTGFDVCGIVFTHGLESGFADPEIVMAGKGDTRLLNADGYTRWWNPLEFPHGDTIFNYIDGMLGTPSDTADFNCTINGYKYFADGLGKDDPLTELDLSKRGMFSGGKKNIRHYKIDMSGGLIFNYAVDACWMKPQGTPPYDAPDDFPPGANRPEAYHVSVTELENSLYCEDAEGYAGGELKLLIDVWDHFNAGLNEVYAESLAGLPITAALTPIGGGEGYSTYELDFTGNDLTQNGDVELLIAVKSENSGYGGILPGKPVCAYFKHTFHVRKPLGWARTWGQEKMWESAEGVAVDTTGNIYVTGTFWHTVDFDPGPGVDEHTAVNWEDAYLCKYDSSGNFLWARTWGGIFSEWSRDVAVDGYGNVYVVGGFMLTVDFDPGPGVDEHTANIDPVNPDFFLSKFDSDGNFIWARTWGGSGADVCQGVAADISGNAYVIGRFDGTVDFDPGPEIEEHAQPYWDDVFLSKFDSNGDFHWVRTWGNDFHYELIHDIAVDDTANVYVAGGFVDIVDFDPGPGVDEHTAIGSHDPFVTKFNSSGDYQGAITWYSSGSIRANSIGVDAYGSVYIMGWFSGTIDFDPGPGTDEHTTANLYRDAFLVKTDTNGSYQWARTWGGPESVQGYAVTVDDLGTIYAAGTFKGTADFDPGPGIVEHTFLNQSGWLSKFDPNGDFIWVRVWGGNDRFDVEAVAADSIGAAYVTGQFRGTADFDPGPGIYERTSNGGYDAFLSKFPPDGNW